MEGGIDTLFAFCPFAAVQSGMVAEVELKTWGLFWGGDDRVDGTITDGRGEAVVRMRGQWDRWGVRFHFGLYEYGFLFIYYYYYYYYYYHYYHYYYYYYLKK